MPRRCLPHIPRRLSWTAGDTKKMLPRGRDHVIILAKDLEKSLGQRPRVFRTTRVSHGLAAACLLLGKVDIDAETAQHSQSRKSDLRVQLIDVARYKETY